MLSIDLAGRRLGKRVPARGIAGTSARSFPSCAALLAAAIAVEVADG
jgi:hypothetical protein